MSRILHLPFHFFPRDCWLNSSFDTSVLFFHKYEPSLANLNCHFKVQLNKTKLNNCWGSDDSPELQLTRSPRSGFSRWIATRLIFIIIRVGQHFSWSFLSCLFLFRKAAGVTCNHSFPSPRPCRSLTPISLTRLRICRLMKSVNIACVPSEPHVIRLFIRVFVAFLADLG